MHIHTNNRTHFSLRVSGDSQQTLALHTGMRKFICLFDESSLLSSRWTGQHRLPASQTKCWQSLLSSGVTLLHGLSDGLSTLPPLSTVHTVMKYDLISVSAALSVTPHCLKLCHSNFLHISILTFFPLPFALVLPRLPRISYSAPNKEKPLTLKRDCSALVSEVKPLSLFFSEMQSLTFSVWISKKQLMQRRNP